MYLFRYIRFPGASVVKNLPASAGGTNRSSDHRKCSAVDRLPAALQASHSHWDKPGTQAALTQAAQTQRDGRPIQAPWGWV